ncbi:MAG: porin [Geobacteraceae bacterium]|nr:porin [Geobacteraceae bacterium]
MKRFSFSSAILGLMGCAALALSAATPAHAGFVVGGENGWQFSVDGMINVFMVYDAKSQLHYKNGQVIPSEYSPDGLNYYNLASERQSFRIRTGLLPSIFGFNVKSPTINGVDYAARLGLYPQIQNSGTRVGLGPGTGGDLTSGGTSIDIREVFFTADGKFGQFLIGRALNLFEGKNILTDMTLMGNGVPLNMTGGGVDLGHIGYGYTYTSFGPQFRYTTPDMSGFKVAFAIADPSNIGGAKTINQPRFETELSYAKDFGAWKLNSWLAGLYQEAKFNAVDNAYDGTLHKVCSLAGAGGMQAWFGPVEFLISGFGGKGIGIQLTQVDGAVLDDANKERVSYGGLTHLTYTIGKAKIGAQYGINYVDRTDADNVPGFAGIKSKQAVTGGVYYNITKSLLLVGEYTWAMDQYYDSARQTQNIVSLGTIFTW